MAIQSASATVQMYNAQSTPLRELSNVTVQQTPDPVFGNMSDIMLSGIPPNLSAILPCPSNFDELDDSVLNAPAPMPPLYIPATPTVRHPPLFVSAFSFTHPHEYCSGYYPHTIRPTSYHESTPYPAHANPTPDTRHHSFEDSPSLDESLSANGSFLAQEYISGESQQLPNTNRKRPIVHDHPLVSVAFPFFPFILNYVFKAIYKQ